MNFLKNAKRLPGIDWNLSFFGAHIQSVSKDWQVPEEKHQAFEFIYIIDGIEQLSFKNNHFILNTGDFALIPPGFKHTIKSLDKLNYFCFHFGIDEPVFELQLIQNASIHYESTSTEAQKLTPYFKKFIQLIHANSTSFTTKMQLQIILSEILIILDQQTQFDKKCPDTNQLYYARLIAEMLKNNLSSNVSSYLKTKNYTTNDEFNITKTMQDIGISTGYGFRIFKKIYGLSPRQYLSRLKLKKAQQMMLNPQFSMSDVAFSLGYQNISSFSRQFKRWTGYPPITYRSNMISPPNEIF